MQGSKLELNAVVSPPPTVFNLLLVSRDPLSDFVGVFAYLPRFPKLKICLGEPIVDSRYDINSVLKFSAISARVFSLTPRPKSRSGIPPATVVAAPGIDLKRFVATFGT